MTLPLDGPITMGDLQQEFITPLRTPLTDYVRGGLHVPDAGGTEFPNGNIPTDPPLDLTNFYGASRNPNPVEVSAFVLDGEEGDVKVLSAGAEGLFVEPFNGVLPLQSEAQFALAARFKCGPTYSREYVGDIYASEKWDNCRLNADVMIGLTQVNPLFASKTTIMSNFVGLRVLYYTDNANSTDGIGEVIYTGGYDEWLQTSGYGAVRPTTGQFAEIRLSRGEYVYNYQGVDLANWIITLHDTNGAERYSIGANYSSNFPFNVGGWPVFINNFPNGGDVDITVDFARAFVGGYVPPW